LLCLLDVVLQIFVVRVTVRLKVKRHMRSLLRPHNRYFIHFFN
uniref:Transposase n=1 Tax=Anisakis simplex TaxID=6269 RepID=A0A0M3JM84_ANISI